MAPYKVRFQAAFWPSRCCSSPWFWWRATVSLQGSPAHAISVRCDSDWCDRGLRALCCHRTGDRSRQSAGSSRRRWRRGSRSVVASLGECRLCYSIGGRMIWVSVPCRKPRGIAGRLSVDAVVFALGLGLAAGRTWATAAWVAQANPGSLSGSGTDEGFKATPGAQMRATRIRPARV